MNLTARVHALLNTHAHPSLRDELRGDVESFLADYRRARPGMTERYYLTAVRWYILRRQQHDGLSADSMARRSKSGVFSVAPVWVVDDDNVIDNVVENEIAAEGAKLPEPLRSVFDLLMDGHSHRSAARVLKTSHARIGYLVKHIAAHFSKLYAIDKAY